jgi:hypothetical protein
VEHFVDAHPELPQEERVMLLGWRDVLEGIFEVRGRDGNALVVVSLIDELAYRVHSNVGPSVFADMRPESFLITRLVPIGDEWLLSGMSRVLPAASRLDAYRLASDLASRNPALVFRNPEKVEQGWELQRAERRHFIAFFGSDFVVLPGHELAERMRAYAHYRTYEARNDEGKTAADVARETYGSEPVVIDFAVEDDLRQAETVGVTCDEVDGYNFFADFGLVQDAFVNPELAANRRHRDVVLEYLQDSSVPPSVFRRLADQDPGQASRVFQQVLRQPNFSWERDGEALLRRCKASYFEKPPLPGVTPLTDRLARAQLATANAGKPRPGRSRPPRHTKRGAKRKR